MKFEQAFYTREMITGLGVYASSSKDYEFQNKCSRVGSAFETEPGQDTAEFVYYSDDFNRYVGVGVSLIPMKIMKDEINWFISGFRSRHRMILLSII